MSSDSGDINLSDISDSNISAGNIVSGQVGGDAVGRDKVVNITIINLPDAPAPTTPSPVTDDGPIPPSPYRGLFAFRPEHAHLFFGREKFTTQLVQAVERRSFVTVLGASGSGKSSVVFAGLVPALDSGGNWLFTTFRPGADPFLGLANALVPLIEPELSITKQIGEARDMADRLRHGRVPLSDYLNHIQRTHPDHRLLLIADQFEELYTLTHDADARHAFLDMLIPNYQPSPTAPVLPVSSAPLHLILTLRADFLSQASLYRPFADALQGTTELLGPMTRAEMTKAIEKPAALRGVTFEANLVERLLNNVGEEEGSLPLLEFALDELWQHQQNRTLTHVAYDEIGGVKGALSRHADRVYRNLSPQDQERARRIFVQLVNPGAGTEDTRRLALRNELAADWPLVTKLASTRLVITNRTTPTPPENKQAGLGAPQESVEVVHEALIRHWERLRNWMNEDRTFRAWQERLRFALRQWQEANRDDGALLRGAPLAEAEGWLAEREADLNLSEREFIQVGLNIREQDRKNQGRTRSTIIGVAIAVVITSLISLITLTSTVRQTENVIVSSLDIQRQVLEMDSHLQQARRLEKEFFLLWPTIGFEDAFQSYAEEHREQISEVITISSNLQKLIAEAEVGNSFQRTGENLKTFQALVTLYSSSFDQAVDLTGQLAESDTGVLATLEKNSILLRNTLQLATDSSLLGLYREMRSFEKEYLLSRKRPDMQSTINMVNELRLAISSSEDLDAVGKTQAQTYLEGYESAAHNLIDLDNQIRTLRNGFDLQSTSGDPIANELLANVTSEANLTRQQVANTRNFVLPVIVAISIGIVLASVYLVFLGFRSKE